MVLYLVPWFVIVYEDIYEDVGEIAISVVLGGWSWVISMLRCLKAYSDALKIVYFSGLRGRFLGSYFFLRNSLRAPPLGGLNTGNVRFVATLLLSILSNRLRMIRPPAIWEQLLKLRCPPKLMGDDALEIHRYIMLHPQRTCYQAH